MTASSSQLCPRRINSTVSVLETREKVLFLKVSLFSALSFCFFFNFYVNRFYLEFSFTDVILFVLSNTSFIFSVNSVKLLMMQTEHFLLLVPHIERCPLAKQWVGFIVKKL